VCLEGPFIACAPEAHVHGDVFRNVIERRYSKSMKSVKNAAADAERPGRRMTRKSLS